MLDESQDTDLPDPEAWLADFKARLAAIPDPFSPQTSATGVPGLLGSLDDLRAVMGQTNSQPQEAQTQDFPFGVAGLATDPEITQSATANPGQTVPGLYGGHLFDAAMPMRRPYFGLPSPTHPGNIVALPDGSKIPDATSPTGYLMSPHADPSDVAAAGRQAGSNYQGMLSSGDPDTQAAAFGNLVGEIGANVGTGGKFDYQRQGNIVTGFTHGRQFRNASNFNVGLFMQQTGAFSLPETLNIAGAYARLRSNNYNSGQPYGLDPQTAQWITEGYKAGQNQTFSRHRPK